MSTSTPPTVLVTGASGTVGSEVCRLLRAQGAHVRAATRDPQHLPAHGSDETVRLDLADPSTLEPALERVDAVYLMWPFFDGPDETRRRVAPVAEQLGAHVRRVVYVSSETVEHDPNTLWGAVEDAVADHVAEWTVLRPTGFAANARQWKPQIDAGDVVRWPFGQMARPLIHESDIAGVAALALTRDGHQGHRYVLSGPDHVTQQAQVEHIGAAIGRPLHWQDLDRLHAETELDLPTMMLDAWEGFITRPEPVTDEVERLLGRPARRFADWARDHAGEFR